MSSGVGMREQNAWRDSPTATEKSGGIESETLHHSYDWAFDPTKRCRWQDLRPLSRMKRNRGSAAYPSFRQFLHLHRRFAIGRGRTLMCSLVPFYFILATQMVSVQSVRLRGSPRARESDCVLPNNSLFGQVYSRSASCCAFALRPRGFFWGVSFLSF